MGSVKRLPPFRNCACWYAHEGTQGRYSADAAWLDAVGAGVQTGAVHGIDESPPDVPEAAVVPELGETIGVDAVICGPLCVLACDDIGVGPEDDAPGSMKVPGIVLSTPILPYDPT